MGKWPEGTRGDKGQSQFPAIPGYLDMHRVCFSHRRVSGARLVSQQQAAALLGACLRQLLQRWV